MEKEKEVLGVYSEKYSLFQKAGQRLILLRRFEKFKTWFIHWVIPDRMKYKRNVACAA